MDILKNLFYGFPDLWGGGVAHSVLILALVITLGSVSYTHLTLPTTERV